MAALSHSRARPPTPLDYGEISRAYLTSRMWAATALSLGAAVFAVLYQWTEMGVVVVGGGASALHSLHLRGRRHPSPEPILYSDAALIALGSLAVRLVPAAYGAPALMLSTVAFLTLDRRRLIRFLAVLVGAFLPAALASIASPSGIPSSTVVIVAAFATAIFTVETFGVLTGARRALADRRLYQEGVTSIMEAAAGGIVMVRDDRTVGLANAAAVAMLAGPEGLVGHPISMHRGRVFETDGTEVRPEEEILTRVLATGELVRRTERIIESPDGRRLVVDVTGVPLLAKDGAVLGAVLSFSDVTDLRHLAEELARRNDELERAQRSRMELIASVSHELRTPLTAVVGLASELADGDFDGDEARGLARIVSDESREVAAIIDDLLVAARSEAGQLTIRPVEVDLVSEAAQALARLPGGEAALAGESPVVGFVDPVRFRQIVRNLYTNALRYGGTGISVLVELDRGAARLRVVDDGPGISEDRWERIFDPFERTRMDGTPGSVGLGLTVSRRLARMMGGDLTYRHAGGESVFELLVPSSSSLGLGDSPSLGLWE